MELKNTYKSKISEFLIQQDVFLAQIDNDTSQTDTLFKEIDRRFVQFYFCTKGNATFHFNEHHQKPLADSNGFVIYNSIENLPLQLSVAKKSKLSIIAISIQKLHQIFNESMLHLSIFSSINQTKVYEELKLSNSIRIILSQMENYSLKNEFRTIFLSGKLNELLICYFSEAKNKEENCPYLSNQEIARKLKQAKEIIIQNTLIPISNKELANKVQLNPYQLKEGFKKIYGNTPSKFILDYKIEIGKKLLEEKKLKIKEVAKSLGYNNPSHFIDAFKKKHGTTPKQFIK